MHEGGRMFVIFRFLSPFCFLLIEFHILFPFLIKYYHIMFIIILFWLDVIGRRDLFCSCLLCFFPCSRLSSYHLRQSLCLISFLLFPCASVWESTLAWVNPMSYSHTEWYLPFFARWNSLWVEASSIKSY